MRTIKIFWTGIKIALSSRITYRGDFLLRFFMMLIGDLLLPMITLLIYRTGAAFPGWSLHEALLIQAIFMFVKGITFPFFFGMVGNILGQVREGTLDLLLIKPCSLMFLTIVLSFNMEYLGSFFGGLIMIIYLSFYLELSISISVLFNFFLIFLFAMIVLLSFTLIMSGSLFKWVGNSRVYEIFDALSTFCLYPKTIYSNSFQNIISYLIPIAMIAYYPTTALLDRVSIVVLYSALSSLIFFAISILFWNMMLKKYSSAGG
ncbi:ABC transporter permease [Natronospora cellulosivora (SeqCode)]